MPTNTKPSFYFLNLVASGPLRSAAKCVRTVGFLACALMLALPARAVEPASILLLHSHIPGCRWTAEIDAGILEVLYGAAGGVRLSKEYLDAQKDHDLLHLENLKRLLSHKYAGESFNLILANGDEAADFAIGERDELFPGTPIVFLREGDPAVPLPAGVTGIVWDPNLEGTIRLAERLHPKATRLLVVNDRSAAGEREQGLLEEALAKSPRSMEVTFLRDGTIADLERRLADEPPGAVTLLNRLDRHCGALFPADGDEMRRLSSVSTSPLYTAMGGKVGFGIVGGYVADGEEYGRTVAALALRVIEGEPPESIPVGHIKQMKVTADYRELARRNISLAGLPAGSVVLNQPRSFYQDHPRVVEGMVFSAGILALAFVVMASALIRSGRAEARARAGERRFRDLAGLLPEVVFESGRDGIVTYTNKRAMEAFGYTEEEIVDGVELLSLVSDEDRERARAVLELRFKGIAGDPNEYCLRRKDDTTFSALIHTSPIYGEGVVTGVRGILIDISDRKFHEEEQRRAALRVEELYRIAEAQRELYESLLRAIPDPVVVYQLTGEVLYLNPSFTRVFGYTFEELKGRRIPFVPPEERERSVDEIEAVLQGRDCFGFETKRWTKDGREIDIALSSSVYRDTNGNPAGIVVVLTDWTERKAIEGRLRQTQKMEAVGTLASGIAHDFNNILQIVTSYGELLVETLPGDSRASAYAEKVHSAAERGASLVEGLMAFGRSDGGPPRAFDINEEIRNAVAMLRRIFPKPIRIEVDLDPAPFPIRGNPAQLLQAIVNLGTNARDAMPQGGILKIASRRLTLPLSGEDLSASLTPGGYYRITVVDTGTGIAPEVKDHIFEPFYTTKPPGSGTGLGLFMVYGVARNLGGQVLCSSEVGEGTRFDILLPVASLEQVDAPGAVVGVSRPARVGEPATLLVVDDEEDVLEGTALSFEHANYRVLRASTGEKAYEAFCEEPGRISVVVLDFDIPGMGGLKCLELILSADPDAHIVVTSGHGEMALDEFLALGAKDLIAKPYRFSDLHAKVAGLLEA